MNRHFLDEALQNRPYLRTVAGYQMQADNAEMAYHGIGYFGDVRAGANRFA